MWLHLVVEMLKLSEHECGYGGEGVSTSLKLRLPGNQGYILTLLRMELVFLYK